MSVKVFRSSDSNAPQMGGWAGALTDVLLACLVNGYGSVFATGTITSNGTNVSNGDTVTVDNVTYTFKTALTPAAGEVLIGANATASMVNLVAAINNFGTSGTTYGALTQTPKLAYISGNAGLVITVKARKGGTGGNSVGISKVAATLTVSGSVLSGGSGSDTTTSAGWTNPFNGNGGQRVFQGGSGVQHQYHFDDASPNATSCGKEAQFRGSESCSAFQTWTNPFPTIAQFALGTALVARKSATLDTTSRSWIIIADDRTVYVFVGSGDVANTYMSFMFGEFYSLAAGGDSYRSMCIGRVTANSAATTAATDSFGGQNPITTVLAGHYAPRSYTAGGSAVQMTKAVGVPLSISAAQGISGTLMTGADPATGAIILVPITVCEVTPAIRGRMRGFVAALQTAGTFGDQDTVAGSGAYSGRTFLAMKILNGGSATNVGFFDITGAWETN